MHVYMYAHTHTHTHTHLDFLNKRDHLILGQASLMVIGVGVYDRREGSQVLLSQNNFKRQDGHCKHTCAVCKYK
jgi:hypothetical protein